MPLVLPQDDGSLEVRDPDGSIRYAAGNRCLYVTWDGLGNGSAAVTTDGLFLGRWAVRVTVGEQPVVFRRGRAIGRLWELEGEPEASPLRLTSFLAEGASLFQHCALENRGPSPVLLRVYVRWSPQAPFARWERWRSGLARALPRLLRQPRLWEEGWAKVLLPAEVRLRIREGEVCAEGPRGKVWTWFGIPAPTRLARAGREVVLEYVQEIPPGVRGEVVWGLVPSEEKPEAWEAALTSARQYARWLEAVATCVEDPLRRSLIAAGLNAALSAFKELEGDFAGFTAGPDYFYPPRLYFRDGYWTAQVVLPFRPDLVRRHLLSLAQGVHPEGSCPSGVFPPGLFGRPADWLPNHLDAPAFFVLLLADYLRFSEDWGILRERVGDGGPSLWEAAQRALTYLSAQDRDGDGLLEKPRRPNDWADNVYRSVWVTYDQALFAAALRAGSVIAARLGQETLAQRYRQEAERARRALDRLWLPQQGHYANYLRPGGGETNLSVDTLTVLYFGLADGEKAQQLLAAARRLQTRHNEEQPFGDWGVMCVFPPYRYPEDLFGKSADPYRYHNGADWPYWDGVYGAVLREREDPDADYVLTRWWEYGLERGWLTPVEYYSPAYPEGGMLQGWSSMPAAALLPPDLWTGPSRFLNSPEEQ
ncbi:MAG: GH116 family glycosyl hydrolase [Anaerolineae bacterium]|nr:GH116 family glycosyl hydrolase [Anaerolineae bacterium]